MDTIQQSVITLLRSAVTGKSLPLPANFDLEQVRPYIRKHHILPLVYEGALLCGVDSPVMSQLFSGYCKALQVSEGQMTELARVFRAFEEAGIDYMPLKGCRMKRLYPKPELRMMGDADVLIRMEQYDRIVPIMESLGFAALSESDHELPWQNQGLHLELHKRVIPSYNKDYFRYFGDGWQLAKEHEGHYHRMTEEDEWIYLFTHFSKHFRDGGIGCRHVLDLWMYLQAHSQMNENYITGELKTLGLLEFYQNVRRLVAYWFEDGPADDVLELISQYVMASGSWGEMENRVRSVTVRDQQHSVLGFSGKLVYMWGILFPPLIALKAKYTILQKAPWMLPVVWLIRPFYKLLFEHKSLEKRKREMEVLDNASLDAHHEMLQKMGIDYRF